MYCARCNKMIGAQGVPTPPYDSASPVSPVRNENRNISRNVDEQVRQVKISWKLLFLFSFNCIYNLFLKIFQACSI